MVAIGLLLAGVNKSDNNPAPENQLLGLRNGIFDLGSGDFGVLNYTDALEQLESDFHTNVVNASSFNTFLSKEDHPILTNLYDHEVIHIEFFKATLSSALPNSANQFLPNLASNIPSQ